MNETNVLSAQKDKLLGTEFFKYRNKIKYIRRFSFMKEAFQNGEGNRARCPQHLGGGRRIKSSRPAQATYRDKHEQWLRHMT
jgi:hypothetical protein